LSGSLSRDLPATSFAEKSEELATGAGFRVERIVSRGQASPSGFWYDQEEDEWVLVVEGAARIEIAEPKTEVQLGPGEWMFLPARCRHRVSWTDPARPTVWLAVYGQSVAERDS
jgi:cupin 2 domain-containing protein